jgi:orotate phosphoribosyltransferase
MSADALARRVHAAAHITGEFVLRSGRDALVALLPNDIDAIAGLELGGVPLATMASQLSGRPARFVRKQAKEYGTRQLAEPVSASQWSRTSSPPAARCSPRATSPG